MAENATEFDRFHSKIAPDAVTRSRIQSARRRLDDYIAGHEGLSAIQAAPTFLQGSYKNNTLTRPLEGTYDVDIAYPVKPEFTDRFSSSARALAAIAAALAESDDYRERLQEPKERCIRLQYADGFHVDLVPLRTRSHQYPHQVADPPGWKTTTPRELDEWVHHVNNEECRGRFVRTMKFLKRWRDLHFHEEEAPPSIVLAAFAGTHHPYRADVRHRFPYLASRSSDTDAAFFRDTAVIMEDCISRQHKGFTLPNPVRAQEDLAKRLNDAQLHALRSKLIELREAARRAYAEPNDARSARLWRGIFGEDFPEVT